MIKTHQPLTEDQIERKVERITNSWDARLMAGLMTQTDYDHEIRILDRWAQKQYDALRR